MRTAPFNWQQPINPLQKVAANMVANTQQNNVNMQVVTDNTEQTTQPVAEPVKTDAPAPAQPQPAAPAADNRTFWQKYQVLIIILLVAAVALFFWKFKIVSKAALAAPIV